MKRQSFSLQDSDAINGHFGSARFDKSSAFASTRTQIQICKQSIFFILLSSNQDATMTINIIDLGVWVLK